MSRFLLMFLIFMMISNCQGGLGSYRSDYDTDEDIVSIVEIKNHGLYNMIGSIEFNTEELVEKIDKDSYSEFITNLKLRVKSEVLATMFEKPVLEMNQLPSLQSNIVKKANKMISERIDSSKFKGKISLTFALTRLYIIPPKAD